MLTSALLCPDGKLAYFASTFSISIGPLDTDDILIL